MVQRRQGFRAHLRHRGGANLFVHRSEIQDCDNHGLADEQRVEFEVAQGRKGLQATAVRIVK